MPDKRFALRYAVNALAEKKGEVRIYSVIDSFKWDSDIVTSSDFERQLAALGEVDELTVRVNSPGGNVSEAIAMRTALIKHPARKVIDIEGCCDSAATLIACMPGARVRMAKGGEYMIHCSACGARGHADDLLSAYNRLMQTDKDMADIYAERTGKTAEECMELMRAETWYGAQEAMDNGFVDEILAGIENEKIVACAVDADTMSVMRDSYRNVPARALRQDSNGGAAAAGDPAENKGEEVTEMIELKNATAEQLQAENPQLAGAIAAEAMKAERERVKEIDLMTPADEDGETVFADMARDAKENGTSTAEYLKRVCAKQKELKTAKAQADAQKRKDYLMNRRAELDGMDNVGGGDAGDHDETDTAKEARMDKIAAEVAEIAKGIRVDPFAM